MSKNNIIELEGREGPVDPLSERLLWGAQKLIRVLNYLLNYPLNYPLNYLLNYPLNYLLNYLLNYPLNSLRLEIKYFYAELL